MIDTLKPMGLDFSKDLHGHVRVELRDRWTGRVVDSREKDNLVTDAVQKIYMLSRWASTPTTINSPLYQKLLGGLMLFNGTLTEAASNIYLPSDAKLVGFAGQTANADSTVIVSYNSAESVYTSNSFTTVWDFLTSQANGTIAALSRTSYNLVTSPWGSFIATPTNGAVDVPVTDSMGYDATNHYLYACLLNNATINGVSYSTSTIYRIKINLFSVGLTDLIPPIYRWTAVKTLTSSDGSADANDFKYDKYDNNFVYSNGTTLHIVAIDGTHSTKTIAGVSGNNLAVTENYYWKWDGSTAWRIQKSNVANVKEFSYSGTVTIQACENDIAFVMVAGSGVSTIIFLYPDETAVTLGTYGNMLPYDTRQLDLIMARTYFNSGYRMDWNVIPYYLGTIANLNSPVTKTSSQTMKITYTLTEA